MINPVQKMGNLFSKNKLSCDEPPYSVVKIKLNVACNVIEVASLLLNFLTASKLWHFNEKSILEKKELLKEQLLKHTGGLEV
jgi:hypothetical protein